MMGEKDPFDAQVSCLSGIVDLQRACQNEELKFSKETNQFLLYQTLKKVGPWVGQKLISKLVEQGQLSWDENEEYDVEQILDHVLEDDTNFYLIKWKGWSRTYNSWEPKENLDCPELVDEFHTLNSDKKNNTFKRGATWDIETERNTKKRRLDELWAKLNKDDLQGKITPLQLLSASSPHKTKGLLALDANGVHPKGRKLRFRPAPNYADKKKKSYKEKKQEVQIALKEWQDKLNAICNDPASIVVENLVDLEGPPDNFEYINDYRPGEGIEIPQDPLVGCDCTDCYDEKKTCCPSNCGTLFAYYKHRRLRIPPRSPIYECNKRCKCPPECPNRVVQHGRKCKVSVFRTHNGRGWGVKTLQKIKKGTFVIEYVGEVITNEEAERRGKQYDAECRTYLFDLDYNDGDCPFTVDARFYGNVSHFVNHSCDPNLVVYGVWINTLDPRLPRIALFSGRDIEKGEELTFDYMMTGDTTQQQVMSPPPTAVNPVFVEMGGESLAEVHTQEAASRSPSNLSDETVHFSCEGIVQDGTNSMLTPASPETSPVKQPPAEGSGDASTEAVIPTPGKEGKLAALQVPEAVFASPRRSSSANKKEQYRIVCQCGAKNCRKYLF